MALQINTDGITEEFNKATGFGINEANNKIVKDTTKFLSKESLNQFRSYGGSSTHIYIDFHLLDKNDNIISVPIYFGSVITISYSVYRSKQSVFNCGDNTIDGFAIGNKYVAGSLIKSVFADDEFNGFLNIVKDNLQNKQIADIIIPAKSKEVQNIMKDDLITCDINIVYASELTGAVKHEVIYGANFINNGQVMSVNDIITESTLSYVARSVKTMDDVSSGSAGIANNRIANSATALLMRKVK